MPPFRGFNLLKLSWPNVLMIQVLTIYRFYDLFLNTYVMLLAISGIVDNWKIACLKQPTKSAGQLGGLLLLGGQ